MHESATQDPRPHPAHQMEDGLGGWCLGCQTLRPHGRSLKRVQLPHCWMASAGAAQPWPGGFRFTLVHSGDTHLSESGETRVLLSGLRPGGRNDDEADLPIIMWRTRGTTTEVSGDTGRSWQALASAQLWEQPPVAGVFRSAGHLWHESDWFRPVRGTRGRRCESPAEREETSRGLAKD